MNRREQARFDMLKRVGTFGTNNAADFTTPVPPAATPSAGQTQAKTLLDSINTATTGLVDKIGKNAESQAGGTGDFRVGTTSKSVQRHALMEELKGINRSAAAIAEAQGKPEIMDNFRMPYGVSDVVLAAKANAMADAAGPMTSDFVAHGHSATFVADLQAQITTFDQADDDQNTGEQKQVNATAGFNPLLKQGMTTVKQLDAFMHNFYKTNAAKLGEWHTAAHVERQAAKKKKTPAPATPTPA